MCLLGSLYSHLNEISNLWIFRQPALSQYKIGDCICVCHAQNSRGQSSLSVSCLELHKDTENSSHLLLLAVPPVMADSGKQLWFFGRTWWWHSGRLAGEPRPPRIRFLPLLTQLRVLLPNSLSFLIRSRQLILYASCSFKATSLSMIVFSSGPPSPRAAASSRTCAQQHNSWLQLGNSWREVTVTQRLWRWGLP